MLKKFSRYVVRCHLRLINVDIMRMKSHVFSVGGKGYTGSSKLTSKEYLRISNIPFDRRPDMLAATPYSVPARLDDLNVTLPRISFKTQLGRLHSQLPGNRYWGKEVREMMTDQCRGANASLYSILAGYL